MNNISYWHNKIRERKKHTTFRSFIMSLASQRPLAFYKNNGFISIFPPERITNIISHEEYYNIRDTLDTYGQEYNFSLSFFDNFEKLYTSVPFPPTILIGDCENSEFSDQTMNTQGVYLSFVTIKDCEQVAYSISTKESSKNVFNSMMVWDNSENVFFATGVIKSSSIFYSRYIVNSYNIYFSTNLIGCSNCIDCDSLENKKHCIENRQYTKEEYEIKKEKLLKNKEAFLKKYLHLIKKNTGKNIASSDTTGFFNIECNNVTDAYFSYQVTNGKNIFLVGGKDSGENMYDCFLNTPPQKDIYGVCSSGFSENIYNSCHVAGSTNIYYCMNLESCSFCIGCIGLKNKSYHILNKEYSKEHWLEIKDKIFSKMESDDILGDYFPGKFNPFYFNDTIANMLGNFTKEEIISQGYMWRDEILEIDIPQKNDIIPVTDLSNYQGYDESRQWCINKDILKKVIKDKKGNYYRIIQMEYDFLIKHHLPLPEMHWLERIKRNFGL